MQAGGGGVPAGPRREAEGRTEPKQLFGDLIVVDEVPEHFPATVLWQFRLAALGTQLVLWATLGLLFGWLTERRLQRAAPHESRPAAPAPV